MTPTTVAKKSKFDWRSLSPEILWYLVGLITSDGCLSPDGRHIDITAKDSHFLLQLKKIAKIPQKVAAKYNGNNQLCHHIQIGSVDFYRFLLSTGLTPRKSKTLGEIDVPPPFFTDFLRGIIDGDGGIRQWTHPTNGGIQWSLRIVSGSKKFLQWLEKEIFKSINVTGHTYDKSKNGGQAHVLKFGKLAAAQICNACYIKTRPSLYLDRKFNVAKSCVTSKRGWGKSKTVMKARVAKLADAWDSSKRVTSLATEGQALGELGGV